MTIQIDLHKLIPVVSGDVVPRIEKSVREKLAVFPEVLERLENSISFSVAITKEHPERYRSGLVRASLTELVSVEDVQKTD